MFCRKTCVLRFGKNENKMDLVTLCYFIDRIIVTTVNRNVRIYIKKKYCPNVVSYLSYISGNIRLSFFYENKLKIN